MELAIVIPTMNRSELLLGQLFFYDSFDINVKVYIGDSSTEDHKKLIRKGIESLKHITVEFIDCPRSMMQVEVIIDLINRAKEEFISVSGDDDYHVISHAVQSIQFLKKNPSYAACTGSVALASTALENNVRTIKDIADYSPKRAIESNDPLERIKLMAENYYLPLFCICRTKDFVEAFKANEKIKSNIFWAETLPAFKLIAAGKLHVLDGLAMIRGTHDLRPEYESSMKDTFLNKDWTDSLHVTLESLVSYLSQMGVDSKKAKSELGSIFSRYYLSQLIATNLQSKAQKTFKQKIPSPLKRILKEFYFRMNSDRINGGSQKPYSRYYDLFSKLSMGFRKASEVIKQGA